jgi:heme O synthase-like polyprenyltransferase
VAIDLTGGNPEMDYVQAESTYKQFIRLTKISIAFLVVLLAGMAYFLT